MEMKLREIAKRYGIDPEQPGGVDRFLETILPKLPVKEKMQVLEEIVTAPNDPNPPKREYAKEVPLPKLSESKEFVLGPALQPVDDVTITIPKDSTCFITTAAIARSFDLKSGDTVKVVDGKLLINGEIYE
jgi:hypothetical protein